MKGQPKPHTKKTNKTLRPNNGPNTRTRMKSSYLHRLNQTSPTLTQTSDGSYLKSDRITETPASRHHFSLPKLNLWESVNRPKVKISSRKPTTHHKETETSHIRNFTSRRASIDQGRDLIRIARLPKQKT